MFYVETVFFSIFSEWRYLLDFCPRETILSSHLSFHVRRGHEPGRSVCIQQYHLDFSGSSYLSLVIPATYTPIASTYRATTSLRYRQGLDQLRKGLLRWPGVPDCASLETPGLAYCAACNAPSAWGFVGHRQGGWPPSSCTLPKRDSGII